MSLSPASDGEPRLPSRSSLLDNTVINEVLRESGSHLYVDEDFQGYKYLHHTNTYGYDFLDISPRKVVISGKLIEIFDYNRPIHLGRPPEDKKLHLPGEETEKERTARQAEYRKRSALKALTKIRRLAQSNFYAGAKFTTLTIRDNVDFDLTSLSACWYEHKLYMEKLRRFQPGLKHITVAEFQKRGAVHFHQINNLKYLSHKRLERMWGHGFVFIQQVKDTSNIGAYLSKYMKKNMTDPRFIGSRSYNTSRNLTQSQSYYGIKADILEYLVRKKGLSPDYQSEYSSIFQQKTIYRVYNLYKSPAQK